MYVTFSYAVCMACTAHTVQIIQLVPWQNRQDNFQLPTDESVNNKNCTTVVNTVHVLTIQTAITDASTPH